MFKDKKTLKKSVINHVNYLFKNTEKIQIIYTELKNSKTNYEEHCLLFFTMSQKFVYHYWTANKVSQEEININSIDFGLIHNVGIINIEKLINPIIIEKANYYLKNKFMKKLAKKLPNKNQLSKINKI